LIDLLVDFLDHADSAPHLTDIEAAEEYAEVVEYRLDEKDEDEDEDEDY
jgi:hypothetical protein